MAEVLRVEHLNAWYGESHILHGVDLTVNQGEVVTLLGRNGSGRENNQTSGEEVFVHKDGHFYPIAFTASPVREMMSLWEPWSRCVT